MSDMCIDQDSQTKVLVEAMYASDSSSCSPSPKDCIPPSPVTSTYLGSSLWDQTIPFDPGCKDSLDYLELENFLNENKEFIDIKNIIDSLDEESGSQTPSLEPLADLATPVHVPQYFTFEESRCPPADRPQTENKATRLNTPPTESIPAILRDTFSLPSTSFSSDENTSSSDSGSSISPQHHATKSPHTSPELPAPQDEGPLKKRPLSDDEEEPQTKRASKMAFDSTGGIEKFGDLTIGPSPSKGRTKAKKKATQRKSTKRSNMNIHEEGSDEEFMPQENTKKKKRKKKTSSKPPSALEVGIESKLPFLPKVDLKPQPVVKKGSKKYVPPDAKDDKYWARREKNNVAAKRSRDARRMKENQIVMRATVLEEEHSKMVQELKKANKLIESLRKRLSKYEKV